MKYTESQRVMNIFVLGLVLSIIAALIFGVAAGQVHPACLEEFCESHFNAARAFYVGGGVLLASVFYLTPLYAFAHMIETQRKILDALHGTSAPTSAAGNQKPVSNGPTADTGGWM